MIIRGVKLAGVMGWPVKHSLSPRLHNYWLNQYGIDGVYIPMAVDPINLDLAVKALPALGFKGVNVTVPHKEKVMEYMDNVDETARIIGAVNTITIDENGKLHGTNTDAYGFCENLRSVSADVSHVLVIGAGGAARAVVYALIGMGAKHLTIANRTVEKAQSIAQHFSSYHPHIKAVALNEAELEGEKAAATLIVNTTSVGLAGSSPLEGGRLGEGSKVILTSHNPQTPTPSLPLAGGGGSPLDLTGTHPHALITDLMYNPLQTAFLQQAQKLGLKTLDGLGMLLYQAVPGFEKWFGMKPEVNENVRKYLLV